MPIEGLAALLETPQLDRPSYAPNRDFIGAGSKVAVPWPETGADGPVCRLQVVAEPRQDDLAIPGKLLDVLRPLEVRSDDAPRVGEEIGYDDDAALA